MSITANWEKKEGNEGTLTVEVSADKFDEALDSAFKKVVKTVSLPGFRKGRIPRPIFEQRFGVESLYQDAIDIILPEAYEAGVTETGIFPVDQPAIDIEEIEKGKGFKFTADITVKPDVILGQYEGIEVEEEDITVTDEEVEEAINQLREGQAELVLKEEGTVEEGDTVVIDFEGFLGDEPFEGGKAENHSLEIGSGQFIPGFEDQLIGKESGVETEVNVTFPEEYQAANLAGQEATFKVKIHEIKTKELPELDDEFAKDVDEEVESLEELRKVKKQDLENGKKHEAENKKREYVIEQVTNNAEVDIPDAMVDSEVQQMLREFEQNLQMQGMTLENYTEFSGQSEDELKEQMKKDAGTRVKTSLTLEAITKDANIEVTDEDVSAELDKLAEMYQMEKEQIVGMLGGNDAVLKDDLIIKKAVDYIVEKSVTK